MSFISSPGRSPLELKPWRSFCRPSGVNCFLQTTSDEEPLGQFQPNLVGNRIGDVDSDLFK